MDKSAYPNTSYLCVSFWVFLPLKYNIYLFIISYKNETFNISKS